MKHTLTYLIMALALVTSANAGALTPQNLTPAGFDGARQPQAVISPSGEIFVVFGQQNAVYLTRSTDQGQTFSPPAKVADVPGLLLGMRRGPRVAVSSNRIVVMAPSASLKSYISDDDGKTWSDPIAISDRSTSTAEGLANITALPDGSFYAVWLDSRGGGGNQVEGARLDAGATAWGNNVAVYISPDKTVCQCCHPSVISDAKGKLTVMWRNVLAGNRDFYIAESSDRGDTFSPAAKLGTGSWKFNACPMDGGSLTATGDGIMTIWRRQNAVFVDKPGEAESQLAQGTQPVIGEIHGEPIAVYQANSDIVMKRGRDSAPTTISTGSYPSLASSPDGKEVFLVWDHVDGAVAAPQFVVLH